MVAERTLGNVFGAINTVEGMFTGPIQNVSWIVGTVETNVRVLFNFHLVTILLGLFVCASISDCTSNLENCSIGQSERLRRFHELAESEPGSTLP